MFLSLNLTSLSHISISPLLSYQRFGVQWLNGWWVMVGSRQWLEVKVGAVVEWMMGDGWGKLGSVGIWDRTVVDWAAESNFFLFFSFHLVSSNPNHLTITDPPTPRKFGVGPWEPSTKPWRVWVCDPWCYSLDLKLSFDDGGTEWWTQQLWKKISHAVDISRRLETARHDSGMRQGHRFTMVLAKLLDLAY
jgi:hypothetical protein